MAGVAEMLARNAAYTKPGASGFDTQLPQMDEFSYRDWVQQNHVPTQPDAKGMQDYDMRGYYRTAQSPGAWNLLRSQGAIPSDMEPLGTKVDPNDNKPHYPDYWKTPAHETFSNESQWATPMAPQWTPDDKLAAPSGRVMFDDRKQQQQPTLADTIFSGLR
jgi:hypothetical protein